MRKSPEAMRPCNRSIGDLRKREVGILSDIQMDIYCRHYFLSWVGMGIPVLLLVVCKLHCKGIHKSTRRFLFCCSFHFFVQVCSLSLHYMYIFIFNNCTLHFNCCNILGKLPCAVSINSFTVLQKVYSFMCRCKLYYSDPLVQ